MEETGVNTGEGSGMGKDRIQKGLRNPKSLPPKQPHKSGTVYLGQE